MAAEVEEKGPIPNLALNAILIPVFEETASVNILFNLSFVFEILSYWRVTRVSY